MTATQPVRPDGGGDLSVLCRLPEGKDEKHLYAAMYDVVRKAVINAAIHRPQSDIMLEVYLAGLWHGVKLGGPPPRKPDYLELALTPRRRGRPKKGEDDGPIAA